VTRKGEMVTIPVLAIEFREGGNTLWIHGPQGGTVLRLKTLDGAITSKHCQSSPTSHGNAIIQGDLEICVGTDGSTT
jgi:hypothetical protein